MRLAGLMIIMHTYNTGVNFAVRQCVATRGPIRDNPGAPVAQHDHRRAIIQPVSRLFVTHEDKKSCCCVFVQVGTIAKIVVTWSSIPSTCLCLQTGGCASALTRNRDRENGNQARTNE